MTDTLTHTASTSEPERPVRRRAQEVLISRTLREHGVTDLFYMMGMGGPDSPAVTTCLAEGIKGYFVRHESPAAMMAHAYARLTGKLGVCVTPLGPGTTNALTGIANAYLDASPVLLICNAGSRTFIGREGYQEQNQLAVFKPVVKAAYRVELAERIPEILSLAIHEATTGRKGPVYVEIPQDVLDTKITAAEVFFPQPAPESPRPALSEADLDRIVTAVGQAQRPLVYVGSGIIWSGAEQALRTFIEATGIPVVTTPQSRGVVSEDHELVLTASKNRATREADLVLTIGTRPNWLSDHFMPPRFDIGSKFVTINIEPGDVGRLRTAHIGAVADARTALEQLTERFGNVRDGVLSEWAAGLVAKDAAVAGAPNPYAADDTVPIHPLRMCHEIRQLLPADAVFILDGHETLEFARRAIPSLSVGNYLTSGPNGCMGVGVPMAIGAKVACPDRPVVVLMGDGGFGWHGMEMETAIRHGIKIVGIVMNNAGFTSSQTGGETGRRLGYLRYDEVVRSLGGHGEFVERPGDIGPAIERAFAAGVPALVNICVDEHASAAGGLGASLVEMRNTGGA
jgi:acetolactate synthase-1/2/3 large subunit